MLGRPLGAKDQSSDDDPSIPDSALRSAPVGYHDGCDATGARLRPASAENDTRMCLDSLTGTEKACHYVAHRSPREEWELRNHPEDRSPQRTRPGGIRRVVGPREGCAETT